MRCSRSPDAKRALSDFRRRSYIFLDFSCARACGWWTLLRSALSAPVWQVVRCVQVPRLQNAKLNFRFPNKSWLQADPLKLTPDRGTPRQLRTTNAALQERLDALVKLANEGNVEEV